MRQSAAPAMELNHLLLFTAVASSLLLLGRALRSPDAWPWRAGLLVLISAALGWFFLRRYAGFVAISAWLALLVIPALLRDRARGDAPRRRLRFTPAVTVLIALNVTMFVLETILGGSTNPAVLHRLGELDPIAVLFFREYWRIGTALFLHYGVLHLALNLAGLYILGLPLEMLLGSVRFSACYLVAGLCSSVAVVLLTRFGVLAPMQLVGASGAVMGIVGAWGGFLAQHRFDPLAMQRLRNVAIIIVLQVTFDLLTPRVSLSAHLSGLVAGLVMGALLGRDRRSELNFRR